MDMKKSAIRQRREERIRDLLTREELPQPFHELREVDEAPKLWNKGPLPEEYKVEPDPEKEWKKEQSRMNGPFYKRTRFISGLMWRLFFSAILFASLWAIFQFHQPWSLRVQSFVIQSLNREMDFQAAEAWYESYFGKAPSFIPIFKQTPSSPTKVTASKSMIPPIQGDIVQSFAVNLKGVEIAPKKTTAEALQVKSVETGRVIDISKDASDGTSVTIQHAGGIVATYSHLEYTLLQKNDWIEAGDIVGQLARSSDGETPTLFFAVKVDNRYTDPADVVPID